MLKRSPMWHNQARAPPKLRRLLPLVDTVNPVDLLLHRPEGGDETGTPASDPMLFQVFESIDLL